MKITINEYFKIQIFEELKNDIRKQGKLPACSFTAMYMNQYGKSESNHLVAEPEYHILMFLP